MNDHRALLSFYLREHDPDWDGSYVTIKDPSDRSVESLALVEFDFCFAARLGAPNDEVFEGHPLAGKGLDGYTAQIVKNSRWIHELENINSVHRMYNADSWRNLNPLRVLLPRFDVRVRRRVIHSRNISGEHG